MPPPSPAAKRPRRRWLRRTGWTLLTLLLAATVLVNGCTGWLARSIVWGPNTDKSVDVSDDPPADVLKRLGVDRQMRVDVGPPAASLHVFVIEPAAAARATVLVLHGINDRKDTMVGFGRQLAGSGYRVALVDLRAHGRSSGQWLSFGAVESRDLVQVIDALEAAGLASGPVGVFGPSFGGGVAVQLAGRDPRVGAAVSVCGFTSMRDVTPGVVRMYAPFCLGWFLLDSSIQRAVTQSGRVGGFDPDDASPLRAIQRTDAQVLLIHGKNDHKIPPSHSRRLHEAAPDHSHLVLLDGHDHDSILAGDSAGVVLRETVAWFDRWLKP
jgi:pimeloyl-ACP methyl ester carboxylesterase